MSRARLARVIGLDWNSLLSARSVGLMDFNFVEVTGLSRDISDIGGNILSRRGEPALKKENDGGIGGCVQGWSTVDSRMTMS
jgi:hypothetical protein